MTARCIFFNSTAALARQVSPARLFVWSPRDIRPPAIGPPKPCAMPFFNSSRCCINATRPCDRLSTTSRLAALFPTAHRKFTPHSTVQAQPRLWPNTKSICVTVECWETARKNYRLSDQCFVNRTCYRAVPEKNPQGVDGIFFRLLHPRTKMWDPTPALDKSTDQDPHLYDKN